MLTTGQLSVIGIVGVGNFVIYLFDHNDGGNGKWKMLKMWLHLNDAEGRKYIIKDVRVYVYIPVF